MARFGFYRSLTLSFSCKYIGLEEQFLMLTFGDLIFDPFIWPIFFKPTLQMFTGLSIGFPYNIYGKGL